MGWQGGAPAPTTPAVPLPAAGIRALPLTVMSLFMMVPPLPTLAGAAFLTTSCFNSAGYCASPLLDSPLSQHRLGWLATALELVFSPLAMAYPFAAALTPSLLTQGGLGAPGRACAPWRLSQGAC